MKNITTYSASKGNVLLWIAALLSLCSAVAKIVFACINGGIDGMELVVRIILPVAANLLIAIRLPLKGEKQFYVTIGPVLVLAACLGLFGVSLSSSGLLTTLCVLLTLFFMILYFLTFSGKLKSKLFVLLFLLGITLALGLDQTLRGILLASTGGLWQFIAEAAGILAVFFAILSARKLPPYKEGDPYRLRMGDRPDGRLIRNMPVMSKVTPFFMPTRLGRSNYISDTVEISNMERYINQKRREGYKHFGITHVIIAAYIRTTADMPGLNRFVAGQRIYHRFETSVNMVVKKEMNKDSQDSSIKVLFDPADTAIGIYEKFNAALQQAKEAGITNGFDSITHVLDYLPSLVMSFFGFLVRLMDYFHVLPTALEKVSPFHGSLFITSMGSLGIPPIYHHLYDFGTVPVFCAFGHKYTKYESNKNGELQTKKYIDYKVVCDEGICDGFYYASAMKKMRAYMMHPERLDLPPEVVVEDLF